MKVGADFANTLSQCIQAMRTKLSNVGWPPFFARGELVKVGKKKHALARCGGSELDVVSRQESGPKAYSKHFHQRGR